MKGLHLTITGILLSVLIAVPAIAGQGDPPAEKPKTAGKPKAAQTQVQQVKPGAQLDQLRKRIEVRDKATAMRRQMMNGSGGQQSQ